MAESSRVLCPTRLLLLLLLLSLLAIIIISSSGGSSSRRSMKRQISALVSMLATVSVTDLRVFSPEEADPASDPAMEELIPGSMRPGEAYWPEGPSPPPVCIGPQSKRSAHSLMY